MGDHYGYRELLSTLTPSIELPTTPHKSVYFTGASMGGALASMASRNHPGHCEVITFGTPWHGSCEIFGTHYQVRTDPVPFFNTNHVRAQKLPTCFWWQYLPWLGHLAPGYWSALTSEKCPITITLMGRDITSYFTQ